MKSKLLMQLYKRVDGVNLIAVGHFNKREIRELKREGYKRNEPQVNKNGIPVRSV